MAANSLIVLLIFHVSKLHKCPSFSISAIDTQFRGPLPAQQVVIISGLALTCLSSV